MNKKYIVSLSMTISLLLGGCQDEPVLRGEYVGNEPEAGVEEQTEITAHIAGGSQTRTSMGGLDGDKYPVLWNELDKIAVFDSRQEKKEYGLFSGAGTSTASFRGGVFGGGEPFFMTVYPVAGAYMSHDAENESKLVVTVGNALPAMQPYRENSFAEGVFPMAGSCTNRIDFLYHNLCGILALPVKGEGKIKKVFLAGNSGEVLAGNISMSYDVEKKSGAPDDPDSEYIVKPCEADDTDKAFTEYKLTKAATSDENAAGIITVDFGEGLTLKAGKPTVIYIAVFPQTFKKGITVRFIDDNGGTFEKKTRQEITVRRSYVKAMKEFDYEKPEPLETANCYVVSEAGYFMIPAFCMGNRPVSARLPVDENGKIKGNGHDVAADYLWTDIPGAISDIEYIPGKDGYISIKVHEDADGNPPRGNTVIALYDSETKEILWSWHIWMSDFEETRTNGKCAGGESTADGFKSESANGNMIIMDRNLGATSANKNDGWKTYGLYYQMGRKDPFVGASGPGGFVDKEYSNQKHKDEQIGSYYAYEDSPFGIYTNHTEWNTNLTGGWTYEKNYITAIEGYKKPMNFASSYKDDKDTRWTNKDLNKEEPFVSKGGHEDFWNRTKTINDPCPAGWTIIGERNGTFFDKYTSKAYHDNGIYGQEITCTVNKTNYTSWWPASGFRSVDGTMGNLGFGGYYWYYDHIENKHGGHGWSWTYDSKNNVYKEKTNENPMTNHACVIRCVKAKQ